MTKAPSGKFVLRIDPPFHRSLVLESKQRGLSLNRLCNELLLAGLSQKEAKGAAYNFLQPITRELRDHFGDDLLGILVFGSRVTGQATTSSDLDLLVVLSSTRPLERRLYQWWDDKVPSVPGPIVNSQFVHLPDSADRAGGLWCEVAVASRILWERGRRVSNFLEKMRKSISEDRVRRYWSNGQPYWVRIGLGESP